MRFSLLKLLIITTAVSIYAAAVFALPWLLGLLVLGGITFIMPGMYAGGILYSRKYWKAFWVGCGVSGVVPTLVGYWYIMSMVFDIEWQDLIERGNEEQRLLLGILALLQLFPLLGGLAAVAMRRIYKASRSIMPPSYVAD